MSKVNKNGEYHIYIEILLKNLVQLQIYQLIQKEH